MKRDFFFQDGDKIHKFIRNPPSDTDGSIEKVIIRRETAVTRM
jgi:hypothetical protein